MGFRDFLAGALGSFRPPSGDELGDQREAIRQRYVSSKDVGEASRLYEKLHRYDAEMTRRANRAYDREHPEPQEPRHREHGWYLPNDD